MLNAIKDVVRKSSIHVCIVNCGGCNGCDVELVALTSPRYDLEQYGIYVHNNPREADVLLLTGAVTEQWVDNLKRVYDKAPEPKIVVAVGNCLNQEMYLIRKVEKFMLLLLILYLLMQRYLVAHLDLVKF
jgi:membrane-bound hydrogenase subunit ehaN